MTASSGSNNRPSFSGRIIDRARDDAEIEEGRESARESEKKREHKSAVIARDLAPVVCSRVYAEAGT